METVITILSLIALILMSIALLRINKLINSYQKQHELLSRRYSEAKRTSNNAEQRATSYARKIKKIEDIVVKGKENKEAAVITLQSIEKELFAETFLNK